LDGRILAAAHGAMDGRRPASRRASRRWPLGLGVAASLALALGLAWQLRPLPDVAPAYRSEADSALRTAPVVASTASDRAEPLPPPPAETAVADGVQREAATADAPLPVTRSASAEKIAAPAPQPAPVPAAPREAPIVFDAPASTQAMQATTPPTPTKAVASSATRAADASTASTPQAFGTTGAAADAGSTPSPSAERAMAPAAAMQSEPTRQKIAVPAAAPPAPPVTSADEDMPIDDVPPATVASPQVRDAWLARIRELATDGNIEDARASLREFQHRYPEYPLPQDLRALLP
jgi:hypothetical protein